MRKTIETKSTLARRLVAAAGAGVLIVGVAACGANTSSEQPSNTPEAPTTSSSQLPTEPEVPAGKVAVSFEVQNCDNCNVTAEPTGGKSIAIPLTGGRGSTLLGKDQIAKTFFTIDGTQFKGAMAMSTLITQLPGKAAGSAVNNDEVKNASKGNICLAPATSQHLNIKAKVVPVASGSGTMARFWADPTLDGAQMASASGGGSIDLHNGVAGVQNSGLC